MNGALLISSRTLRIHEIAIWCWGLMVLVLPFSTALALFFSALGAGFSLAGLRRDLLLQTLRSPIALLALALLTWLALSMLWSVAPRDELIEGAWKYRKLMFIFLLAASFIACNKRPEFLINFFLAGCALVALGSLGSRFGMLELILGPPSGNGGWPIGGTPQGYWLYVGGPDNPTVGRNHITQGAFLAFAAMFAIGRAWTAFIQGGHARYVGVGWALGAMFYSMSVFSMQGRSGYLLLVLGGFFWVLLGLQKLQGWRKLIPLASVAGALALLILSSPHFLKRSVQAVDEVARYSQEETKAGQGVRLAFWQAGLELAGHRPIVGYGVGAYAQAYSEMVDQPEWLRSNRSQPHSEWVNLLVQGGLIAFFLFGLLTVLVIRELVKGWEKGNAYGPLCVMSLFFIFAGFNSAVWDLAEGHFFAVFVGLVAAMTMRLKCSDTGSGDACEG